MSSSERRALLRRAAHVALLRRAAHVALVAAAAPLLGACGFRLRQPPALALQRIALTGFAPRSPLAQALRERLRPQVQLVDDPAQADVILRALREQRERSVVASTAAAQVRELQLRVRFVFRAETPAGRELIPRAELLLARDLSTTEAFALAKEQEEAELYRDMEADIVNQVLRRLAAVVL
jgi:LPS-assembly lipoprotein